MAPDKHEIALLLIDVINHLDFEGNEGKTADGDNLVEIEGGSFDICRVDPSH